MAYKVYYCHIWGGNTHLAGVRQTLEEAKRLKEASEDSMFEAWIVEEGKGKEQGKKQEEIDAQMKEILRELEMMRMKKYIGRHVEFELISTWGVIKKRGVIKKIEFHQGLGKPVFTVMTPFKHTVRLTRDELKFL